MPLNATHFRALFGYFKLINAIRSMREVQTCRDNKDKATLNKWDIKTTTALPIEPA